ncbi:MAG: DUF4339 domain-containing protein [Pirellulales bacterium]|nr:DUF4339 domain-containing protein [Pirellulales bacterium]
MGVRFECPNGHKLNIKTDLIGKRGICPACQARFIVPAESGGRVEAVEAVAAITAGAGGSVSVSAEFASAPAATAPADAWYVRPASGGQFGPATTAVFEAWIAEGRVPGDSWVWRDGWPEWKPARDALAGFKQKSLTSAPPAATTVAPIRPARPAVPADPVVAIAAASVSPAATTHAPESPAATTHRAKIARRKRRNQQITITLALVVAVLMAILAIVLWR